MSRSILAASAAVLLTLCTPGGPALAQDEEAAADAAIDFGDDASPWANDGECDDPRFEGRGMARSALLDSDLRHDASDCRAAFDGDRIALRDELPLNDGADGKAPANDEAAADKPADVSPEPAPDAAVQAADASSLDYGDDSGAWAFDGECDDPRFEGEGVAPGAGRENIRRDASDCRAVVDAGRAVFAGELEPLWEGGLHEGLDFGDNAGRYPGDGECDDPRFAGSNVALGASRVDAGHDAHDCREAFDQDAARYVGELDPAFEGEHDGIDFGDNSGAFPYDDECDDPRFTGDNVAIGASRSNVHGDSADCRAAYDQGEARYTGELEPLFEGEDGGVDYGDNSGPYVEDAECDDPRFSGAGVAGRPQRDNIRHDAHDCHEAVLLGAASYDGELEPLFAGTFEGVDFGDNSGPYTDDMECDDPRFRGFGMAAAPYGAESDGHDAADCQWHFARGFVRYVMADGLFEGRADGIDFGDNSGAYVNDGECDDRRFEGPGVGSTDGANDRKDAHDCRVNFEDGSIVLKE